MVVTCDKQADRIGIKGQGQVSVYLCISSKGVTIMHGFQFLSLSLGTDHDLLVG